MDKSYGSQDGLKQFVEAAHNRGIAVILDVVYNHITARSSIARLYDSPAENPFLESGPVRGICGALLQKLNQGHPFLKEYIRRANEYWLDEFNVDGFRFDMAKCVADDGVNISLRRGSERLEGGGGLGVERQPRRLYDSRIPRGHGGRERVGGYSGLGNTDGMLSWHKMTDPYSRVDREALQEGSDLASSYFANRNGFDQPSGVTYMTSHDEQWLM